MTTNWAGRRGARDVHPGVAYSAARRLRLARALSPTRRIVVPTGDFKVRANDTDYPLPRGHRLLLPDRRATSPTRCSSSSRRATSPALDALRPAPSRRPTHEFFTDARYGELWVGARRGVEEAAVYYDIDDGAARDSSEKDLVALGGADVVTLRGFDESVDALHEESRPATTSSPSRSASCDS